MNREEPKLELVNADNIPDFLKGLCIVSCYEEQNAKSRSVPHI
jgi:hypothetical protein